MNHVEPPFLVLYIDANEQAMRREQRLKNVKIKVKLRNCAEILYICVEE